MSLRKSLTSTLAVAALSAGALVGTAAPASAQTHTASFASKYYSSCTAKVNNAIAQARKSGRTIVSVKRCIQQPGSPYLFEGRVVSKT